MTPREHATRLRSDGMHCNCDLDNWEPEPSTGHSWVCRIHKEAVRLASQPNVVRHKAPGEVQA